MKLGIDFPSHHSQFIKLLLPHPPLMRLMMTKKASQHHNLQHFYTTHTYSPLETSESAFKYKFMDFSIIFLPTDI